MEQQTIQAIPHPFMLNVECQRLVPHTSGTRSIMRRLVKSCLGNTGPFTTFIGFADKIVIIARLNRLPSHVALSEPA